MMRNREQRSWCAQCRSRKQERLDPGQGWKIVLACKAELAVLLRRCASSCEGNEGRPMIDEAVVNLSRLQFATTALYHFLFVPLTLGLSFMMAIMESTYVMT